MRSSSSSPTWSSKELPAQVFLPTFFVFNFKENFKSGKWEKEEEEEDDVVVEVMPLRATYARPRAYHMSFASRSVSKETRETLA